MVTCICFGWLAGVFSLPDGDEPVKGGVLAGGGDGSAGDWVSPGCAKRTSPEILLSGAAAVRDAEASITGDVGAGQPQSIGIAESALSNRPERNKS